MLWDGTSQQLPRQSFIVWACKIDSVIENESVTRFLRSLASTTLPPTAPLALSSFSSSFFFSITTLGSFIRDPKVRTHRTAMTYRIIAELLVVVLLLRAREESQDNVTLLYISFSRLYCYGALTIISIQSKQTQQRQKKRWKMMLMIMMMSGITLLIIYHDKEYEKITMTTHRGSSHHSPTLE